MYKIVRQEYNSQNILFKITETRLYIMLNPSDLFTIKKECIAQGSSILQTKIPQILDQFTQSLEQDTETNIQELKRQYQSQIIKVFENEFDFTTKYLLDIIQLRESNDSISNK